MTKFNEEIKKKFIELMKSNKHSISSAAKEIGISNSVGKRCWKMYSIHGYEGLIMKSGNYSGEFKINAVKYMRENNLSIQEASAKLGIPSHTTLLKWERIYYEEGEEGLLVEKRGRPNKPMSKNTTKTPKNSSKEKEEDLIAEVQRLRAENAYLKKYNALVQEKQRLQAKKKQR